MAGVSSRLCLQRYVGLGSYFQRGSNCDRHRLSPTLTIVRNESTKSSIFGSVFGRKKRKAEEERKAREEEQALMRQEEQFERELQSVKSFLLCFFNKSVS